MQAAFFELQTTACRRLNSFFIADVSRLALLNTTISLSLVPSALAEEITDTLLFSWHAVVFIVIVFLPVESTAPRMWRCSAKSSDYGNHDVIITG